MSMDMDSNRARASRFIAVALAASGLAVLGAACASSEEPVDVTGTYNLNLTNGANDCMLQNWKMGESYMGVTFNVTQAMNDPSQATGTVQHLIWTALARLTFGTNQFTGPVRGASMDLETLGGHTATTQGTCTYTPIGLISATLKGDTLEGTIRYQFKTNGDAACGYRNTCRTIWNFNGTRPPK